MRENLFRKRIKEGKPTLGTHIHSTWPGTVEIIGHTRTVDYIEFLGEYSAYDLDWLDNFARLTELYGLSSMLKVDQSLETFLAQRAVGSGIQSILFTDIRNQEEARRAVKAVRAEVPGGGILGCAMRRDVGYLLEIGSKAYVKAANDTVVAFMIEKKEALDNLDAILDAEGLDMVQFGPCDYSLSLGIPGQWSRPEVKEAERKVITKALQKGILPRVELFDFDEAKEYLDMGVRHFCIGYDVVIQYNWLKDHAGRLKEILSE